jgi:hypothetical protein
VLFDLNDIAFVHDIVKDFAVPGHHIANKIEISACKPVLGVEEEHHIQL